MVRIGGGAVLLIGVALWIFAIRTLVGDGGTADGVGLLEGRGTATPTTTAEPAVPTSTAVPGATAPATGTATATPAPSGDTYTVRAGDTMSRIANELNVTLADLIRANPQIDDPTRIEIGQVLNVPD